MGPVSGLEGHRRGRRSRGAPLVLKPGAPQRRRHGQGPRSYQRTAINRSVTAILQGDKRLLLTLATGTGKTFVSMQIVWKLWKSSLGSPVDIAGWFGSNAALREAVERLAVLLYVA